MPAATSSARPASPGRRPDGRTASGRFFAASPRKRLKNQSLRSGSRRSHGSYQYTANTDGGHTPLLDHIDLAVMGTRNYAWDNEIGRAHV